MEACFLGVLSKSWTGSLVILIVLLARLLLKKLPKGFSYLLWSAVLVQLLCPFSFQNPLSLLPARYQTLPSQQGIPSLQTGIGNIFSAASTVDLGSSQHSWLWWLSILWCAGMIFFLLLNFVHLLLLRQKLRGSIRMEGRVYLSDGISTAFVLGVFRLKIYIPSDLSPEDLPYVVLHEQTHIKHGDPYIKLMAFAALTIHWFNPLAWVAFSLACKDMEMACDESALQNANSKDRRGYVQALLNQLSGQRIVTLFPTAFGRTNAKERIKNIMSFRPLSAGVRAFACIALMVLWIGLLGQPLAASEDFLQFPAYSDGKTDYNAMIYEVDPFRLYLRLPDNWQVHLPPEEERANALLFTPLYFYEGDKLMAVCGYNTFEAIDPALLPSEEYYKAVYSALRLGSLYRWDNYEPISSSAQGETALADVFVVDTSSGTSAAASPVMQVPGILSYDRQLQVYIAIQFSNEVTEEQAQSIAQSVRLAP